MFSPLSRIPPGTVSGLWLAVLLAGCSAQPARDAGSPPPVPGHAAPQDRIAGRMLGERAAAVAVRQVGVPYRYGGSSAEGFDCSGLVNYAYAQAGRKLPRTTAALWRDTRPVRRDDLQVGDLLFFDIQGKVAHVGLYLGDRSFVHAPSRGRAVTIGDLDSAFYRRAFVRAGRP